MSFFNYQDSSVKYKVYIYHVYPHYINIYVYNGCMFSIFRKKKFNETVCIHTPSPGQRDFCISRQRGKSIFIHIACPCLGTFQIFFWVSIHLMHVQFPPYPNSTEYIIWIKPQRLKFSRFWRSTCTNQNPELLCKWFVTQTHETADFSYVDIFLTYY